MREIKFRAWDKELKEIIKLHSFLGDISMFTGEKGGEPMVVLDNGEAMKITELNKVELMQYTGLKDKNGKEIYEGDILEIQARKNADKYDKYYRAVVKWGYSGWGLEDDGTLLNNDDEDFDNNIGITDISEITYDFGGLTGHIENIIIIGNIHENPDLLK